MRGAISLLFALSLCLAQISLAQVDHAYMAIHMEPGNLAKDPITNQPNTQRPSQYWQTLSSFVQLADNNGGHKLTLMFSAQWAYYVISNECSEYPQTLTYHNQTYTNCLQLVRAWEANGHELAFHHHSHDAPSSWDGFSRSQEDAVVNDSLYLGDLNDLFSYLNQLPSSGQIRAGTSGEWVADGLTYAEGGYDESHFLSNPSCLYIDGHFLWRVGMRHYLSNESQRSVLGQINGVSVGELPDAIASASSERIIGFVSHVSNIEELSEIPYKVLFNYLKEQNIALQSLTVISDSYTNGQTPSPDQMTCNNEQGEPTLTAIALDSNFQASENKTIFSGGISQGNNLSDTARINNNTEITISLKANTSDNANQSAEQIIAASHQQNGITTWYQFNTAQGWQNWDTQFNSLSGDALGTLPETLSIDIFQGKLSPLTGSLLIYAGYKLSNGTVVVNSKPLSIAIE